MIKNLLLTMLALPAALPAIPGTERETIYQISTIDALLAGLYDGVVGMDALLEHADFGLGTFHQLDGEMIVVDGEIYQVSADGKAHRLEAAGTSTPFAAVTSFEADVTLDSPAGQSMQEFYTWLDTQLPSPNYFYAIRIDGTFRTMWTRSVPAQEPPYPPLAQIAAQQPEFHFEEIRGTLVGFRCPSFVKGINVPGYHLHFIDETRSAGGHILGFTVDKAVTTIDVTPGFMMLLPDSKAFAAVNLESDQSGALKRVESAPEETSTSK